MAETVPLPMCPMAKTCKSMMDKPFFGVLMLIPGIALIALGVLIVVWPGVLPWLVAAAFILAGGALLGMASFMRGIGAGPRRSGN